MNEPIGKTQSERRLGILLAAILIQEGMQYRITKETLERVGVIMAPENKCAIHKHDDALTGDVVIKIIREGLQ